MFTNDTLKMYLQNLQWKKKMKKKIETHVN